QGIYRPRREAKTPPSQADIDRITAADADKPLLTFEERAAATELWRRTRAEKPPADTPSSSTSRARSFTGYSEPMARSSAPKPGVYVLNAVDAKPKKIDWLWPGWLARGKFHVLAGSKGAGKSTMTFDLFARITAGTTWPDGTP